MAGYQSIFAGSTPTATPTAPTGGGYRSIFSPTTPAKPEFKQRIMGIQQGVEKQQIKKAIQQQNPNDISTTPELKDALKAGTISRPAFLQRFAQLSNAPEGGKVPAPIGKKLPTAPNPYSAGNITRATGSAAVHTGEGILQFLPRQATEIAESLQPTSSAKATPKPGAAPTLSTGKLPAANQPAPTKKTNTIVNPTNPLTKALLGTTPVESTQAKSAGAQASHPGGFNIGPIHLTPKETGAAETGLSVAQDVATVAGGKFAKSKIGNTKIPGLDKIKLPSKVPAEAKPSSTPVKTQTPQATDVVKPSSSEAPTVPKPKIKPLGQEGAVSPGTAVSDVKGLIQKHQASSEFTGDLEKNIDQSEGKKATIAEDTAKVLKSRTELSNADKTTLQDYRDAKNAGQTPKALPAHLQAEDADVTALNKATQSADAEKERLMGNESSAQSIERRNPETYTGRSAMDKGSSLDYVLQGSRKSPLSVSGLSKSTDAGNSRKIFAATDEEGNRRIVHVKNSVLKTPEGRKLAQGKLVTAIDNGGKTSEQLGKLKLKDNQDFLDKELSPYQSKIKNLQKEYDTLGKVRAKGGASDARLTALSRKAALLEDARNFSGLSKSEAKSLHDATTKLQELSRVKPADTNVPGRLKTLRSHLVKLNNQVADIHDKYDPETLDKKVFLGKDGKKYTISQAGASEITKATGTKYYVDPKLIAAKNYADSRTALENARFIESIKTHPDFENFASEPGETAPKGYQSVRGLDQFRGYKFEPKIAEVLDDLARQEPRGLLEKTSQFLRQTIVYFPLKHIVNEGATFAVDRGLSSLVNPMAYKRGAVALVKAYHDVTNMSPDFMAAQEAGLHTTTGGDKALNSVFTKQLKSLSADDRTIQDVAKQWGTSPVRVYNAVQNLTVWQLQDILNMARVNERMAPKLIGKGDSLEDAVAKTQKFNLQYKVPSRVGPRVLPGAVRRGLSGVLRSRAVFFGRYKYDQFRIITNILKDSTNLKSLAKNPKQNAQSLDKLAALAVGAAVLWALVDKGAQKLSGNKNAYISAPGVLGPVETANQVRQGKKAPLTAASSQLYVSSAITGGLDIAQNRDAFTGKQIYDPNSPIKQQFTDITKWIGSQAAPTQQLKQGTGGKNTSVDILLTLASARLPKNSPEVNAINSLKFDSLPNIQNDAKSKAAGGDIQGAITIIRNYDNQVLKQTKTALKTAGQPIPDDKTLIAKLKQQGYYYNPTLGTVKGWQTPASKSDSLTKILSASPAPKKGQPGYLQYLNQQKIKKRQNAFKPASDKQGVIVQ